MADTVTITMGDRVRSCHKDDVAAFKSMGYSVADEDKAKKRAPRKKVVKAEASAECVVQHETAVR